MSMKALSRAKRNTVTIYEVAHRAGVSIATVSRALRDSELVTAETRRRVLEAADELNFKPSRLGRSLAEGRHAANGIVFPDLVGPYYAEVLLGYEETAAELGRSVLILATNGRADAPDQVLELATRVDGMVVVSQAVPDQVIREIAATGTPLVLLAREPVDDLDTIQAENAATAADLADHLVGHGYRSFAYLGDPDASPDVAERYAGFSRGLEAHRVPAPALVPCAFDVDAGYAAARKVLRKKKLPQAIVGANDEVALGTRLAAEELGLDIPVTGWDDVMTARFVGLTTVRQPMRQLGGSAARWLHDRMTDPKGTAEPRRQVHPTQLVIRRSCGPHPIESSTETPIATSSGGTR
jgi:LacI family transcriptional regulator